MGDPWEKTPDHQQAHLTYNPSLDLYRNHCGEMASDLER